MIDTASSQKEASLTIVYVIEMNPQYIPVEGQGTMSIQSIEPQIIRINVNPIKIIRKRFSSILVAMLLVLLMIIVPLIVVFARPQSHNSPHYGQAIMINPNPMTSNWNLGNFKHLLIFGDSYSDENRAYIVGLGNQNPQPSGWIPPVNGHTATGGYIWGRYVNWYSGVKLYDYALSGSVCSTEIVNSGLGIFQYQLPTFHADMRTKINGSQFLDIDHDSSVFAIWCGVNDLSWFGFLENRQVANHSVQDYIDCIYNVFDEMYAVGVRKLVLLNIAALDLAPLYASSETGEVDWSGYWDKKGINATDINVRMKNLKTSVNLRFKSMTKSMMKEGRRFRSARIAHLDVNSIFQHIYDNPEKFLNGTEPLDVDHPVTHEYENGTFATHFNSPDSHMWWDDLHPSEQTERHVAREFVNLIAGNSSYAEYWD